LTWACALNVAATIAAPIATLRTKCFMNVSDVETHPMVLRVTVNI
jgi:hypothetical protein